MNGRGSDWNTMDGVFNNNQMNELKIGDFKAFEDIE